ncbi:hypothetical protein K2224_37905 (plasmid) [Streptomyces sp. BHT-5-2]|uniref:hypothetical protein n=1 Tax=Streptomyces sp. BHT-5-2 TaxID=2866715 RepID=UPI001C8E7123|nr:hypothetical protein [Streptomyces sp. BHT-5-2]QZL08804.1 hypothetical protein K2224_37905 [Streptomyces sp. BHT-5-2]
MRNEEVNGPVACPGCRTWENVPVAEARTDRGERREDLTTKPVSVPKDAGNGCMHVVEGLVLALVAGLAGKYFADERDLPWLTAVGVVVAALILVATIAIVRGETRDARRAQDGAVRAAALAAEARFCYPCQGVFYPSGHPSPEVVTPERFRQYYASCRS